MNTKELKEKLIWCVSNSDFKKEQIERLINEFEQSKTIDEEEFITKKEVLEMCKAFDHKANSGISYTREEIENQDKDIEVLKQAIATQAKIISENCQAIADLKQRLKAVDIPEPKQERFYCREYIHSENMFEL